MEFIPHYVRQKSDLQYGDKVTHENYNEKLNRNTRQGDYNTDILFALFHNANPNHTVHIPYIDVQLENHEGRITTLEDTVDGAVEDIANIISGEQVVGRAEYADNITDAFDAGPNKYYGTNASGIPGFIRVPEFIYADPIVGQANVDGIYYIPGLNSVAENMLTQEVRDKLNREGISSYNDLNNKPQINGVTLTGNKSLSTLGIQPVGDYVTSTTLASTLNSYYTITAAQTWVNNQLNSYYTKAAADNKFATITNLNKAARVCVGPTWNESLYGPAKEGDLLIYLDQTIYP